MEFNEKLQELRKQKGITQEELAENLFVSRTAVSKWESGRGYPGIDSLKAIAKFYKVTVDDLLSGDELLDVAREDNKEKEKHFSDLVYGLLDSCIALLLLLPVFGQNVDGVIQSVPLLSLSNIEPYMKTVYIIGVSAMVVLGIFVLALQNFRYNVLVRNYWKLSLSLNVALSMLFIVSLQPYAASLVFIFLIIKVIMLVKRQ